jgi:cell division control protein 6
MPIFICHLERRAIEIAEAEVKASSSKSGDSGPKPAGLGSPDFNSPVKSLDDIPKVTIRHIMSATSNFNVTANVKKIKDLNVQQKLLLASMVILEPTLGQKQSIEKVFVTLY